MAKDCLIYEMMFRWQATELVALVDLLNEVLQREPAVSAGFGKDYYDYLQPEDRRCADILLKTSERVGEWARRHSRVPPHDVTVLLRWWILVMMTFDVRVQLFLLTDTVLPHLLGLKRPSDALAKHSIQAVMYCLDTWLQRNFQSVSEMCEWIQASLDDDNDGDTHDCQESSSSSSSSSTTTAVVAAAPRKPSPASPSPSPSASSRLMIDKIACEPLADDIVVQARQRYLSSEHHWRRWQQQQQQQHMSTALMGLPLTATLAMLIAVEASS